MFFYVCDGGGVGGLCVCVCVCVCACVCVCVHGVGGFSSEMKLAFLLQFVSR